MLKNTIYLYIRMIVVMAVRLYTSRVILNVLGEDGFGVYSLVAGIVVLFTFLNTTMSSATSRFLTVEIGRNVIENVRKTFQNALSIHIGIACLVLLLGETAGLWFLNNKLVIPADSIFAANVAYQFVLVTVMFQVIQVPFNACIISNEKMSAYAIIEIVNVLLILLVTFSVKFSPINHIIYYSIVVCMVAFIVMLSYIVYCRHNFEEASLKLKLDRDVSVPMLKFSMWDLYGNFCVTARTQGVNFINNMFFGVIINAAGGIALQVQNAVIMFGGNVITAFRPRIIKMYSSGNIAEMTKLLTVGLQTSLYLVCIIALPLLIEIDYVLKLWLGDVPEYTPAIARLCLLFSAVQIVAMTLNIPIHATGRIKGISFIVGTMMLLNLPVAYLLMRYTMNPYIGYAVIVASTVLQILVTAWILKRLIDTVPIGRMLVFRICPLVVILGGTFFVVQYVVGGYESSFGRVVATFVSYFLISAIFVYFLVVPRYLKNKIRKHVMQVVK